MKQIVIKKWIDGEFREVKRYSEEEVVSIRHHTDGLEIILKGNIRLYDTQCIIEFEEEGECDSIRKKLISLMENEYPVCISDKDAINEILFYLKKQGEQKLLNNDKYQTVSVKILDRLYKSEKELEQLKQGEQKPAWSEEDKERMRNTFIEKACEWLKNNAGKYAFVDIDRIGNVADVDLSLVQDFKKYMKGE